MKSILLLDDEMNVAQRAKNARCALSFHGIGPRLCRVHDGLAESSMSLSSTEAGLGSLGLQSDISFHGVLDN